MIVSWYSNREITIEYTYIPSELKLDTQINNLKKELQTCPQEALKGKKSAIKLLEQLKAVEIEKYLNQLDETIKVLANMLGKEER